MVVQHLMEWETRLCSVIETGILGEIPERSPYYFANEDSISFNSINWNSIKLKSQADIWLELWNFRPAKKVKRHILV